MLGLSSSAFRDLLQLHLDLLQRACKEYPILDYFLSGLIFVSMGMIYVLTLPLTIPIAMAFARKK